MVSAVNQPSKYDHGDGASARHRHARGVSAVNQPSKYDHKCLAVGVDDGGQSRPSTNRASTITADLRCHTEVSVVRRPAVLLVAGGVSVVNQPSKYDHLDGKASTLTLSCLGRQPTEQVRSPARDRIRQRLAVSVVNQPSKYDHGFGGGRGSWCCRGLGRQPTEQVRSRSAGPRFDGVVGVSVVNQPSKYDHRLAGWTLARMAPVSVVNQPSKYNHLLLHLDWQSYVVVSVVNQPSKYDHER